MSNITRNTSFGISVKAATIELYNAGDENIDVTGGWDNNINFIRPSERKFVPSKYTANKRSTNILLTTNDTSTNNCRYWYGPKLPINVTGYNHIYFDISSTLSSNPEGSLFVALNVYRYSAGYINDDTDGLAYAIINTTGKTVSGIFSVDISNINEDVLVYINSIHFGYGGKDTITLNRCWIQ